MSHSRSYLAQSVFENLHKHLKPTSIPSIRLQDIYTCVWSYSETPFQHHLSLLWLRCYVWLELLQYSQDHSSCQEGLRERHTWAGSMVLSPTHKYHSEQVEVLMTTSCCPAEAVSSTTHLLQARLCLHFRKLLWTCWHSLDPGSAEGQSSLTLSSRLRTGLLSCPIHVDSKAASRLPLLR